MKALNNIPKGFLRYVYEMYFFFIVILIAVLFLGSCFGLFLAFISTAESASFRSYLALGSFSVIILLIWLAKMAEKGKFTFVIKSIEDRIGARDNDHNDLATPNKNSHSIQAKEVSALSSSKINVNEDPNALSIYNKEHSSKLDQLELQKLSGSSKNPTLESLENGDINKPPRPEEELNSDGISTKNIGPFLEKEVDQQSAFDIENMKVTSLFEHLKTELSSDLKVDYSLLKKLGNKGEQYFMALEKQRLKNLGLGTKTYPLYVAREKGEHWGFDILSLNDLGEQVCLEVKTTNKGKNQPFKITKNELKVMSLYPDNYQIIRIYNFNEDTLEGDFFRIHAREISERYRRKTISYKVKVRTPQTLSE
jgi:hypothetical protein